MQHFGYETQWWTWVEMSTFCGRNYFDHLYGCYTQYCDVVDIRCIEQSQSTEQTPVTQLRILGPGRVSSRAQSFMQLFGDKGFLDILFPVKSNIEKEERETSFESVNQRKQVYLWQPPRAATIDRKYFEKKKNQPS